MSIVNAFVNADRGIVCVDTEAGPDGGPYFEISKLIPLPHMNAVIAGRGVVLFLAGVVTGVVVAGGNFDDLALQMPDILKLASDKAIELATRFAPESLTSEEAGCGEVVIVGFSPARSRIVAHHFRRQTLLNDFVATNNIAQFVAPAWDDVDLDLESHRSDPSREGMKTLAVTQVRLWRAREKAGAAAGGRLIYAEVRRDGMTIESLMEFPERRPPHGGSD